MGVKVHLFKITKNLLKESMESMRSTFLRPIGTYSYRFRLLIFSIDWMPRSLMRLLMLRVRVGVYYWSFYFSLSILLFMASNLLFSNSSSIL